MCHPPVEGSTGREQGIAAFLTVLLTEKCALFLELGKLCCSACSLTGAALPLLTGGGVTSVTSTPW